MKARILLILCLFLSLSAMGQGIVQGPITRTCPTCGKARPECKYKGKHPTCSECKKIIGAKTNACAYGGKHPAPEKTCSSCGKPQSKCDYHGSHPTCSECKMIIGAKTNGCAYGGKHPAPEKTCSSCGKVQSKCDYHGSHPTCSECKKIIGAKSNGCAYGGNHPEAAGYDVTISCNVPTATLYIDGTANGTASGTRFLKTGSHSIRATASGYNDYSSTITVNKQSTSLRITMEKKPEPAKPAVTTTGTVNGHEWVDLGLPSGTKWATTNVGASSPSDYGKYYAWGETSKKSSYTWQNLRYRTSGDSDDNVKFSKYVTDSKYGTVDGKKELDPSDDAAYVNWGSGWCMPSLEQIEELKEKCQWTWTTMGGHNGYKVVGPNRNSLFLPAAGYRSDSSSIFVGSWGCYWSRSLQLDGQWGAACELLFNSGGVHTRSSSRSVGQSVRAVLAH